jgi:hypothetical protein
LNAPYKLLVVGLVAVSGALSTYLGPGLSAALSGVTLVVASNLFAYSLYRGSRWLPVLVPAIPAAVMTRSVCHILALPDFLVDAVLLATLLATVALHWGIGRVRAVFRPAVPVALLSGVILGIWVGVSNPLRFALTPILEVTAYAVLREGLGVGEVVPYAVATLVALDLNPATYVDPAFLVLSSALYLAKVLTLELRSAVAPYILSLDVLLRPALAGVL